MVVDSKCKYLDLKGLHRYLERKDFAKAFEAKNFLDQQRLLRDMHAGNALQDFVAQYQNTKLDVVSLAEVQAMMEITGIKLSKLEVEWLFAECYAPMDLAAENGRSATGRGLLGLHRPGNKQWTVRSISDITCLRHIQHD